MSSIKKPFNSFLTFIGKPFYLVIQIVLLILFSFLTSFQSLKKTFRFAPRRPKPSRRPTRKLTPFPITHKKTPSTLTFTVALPTIIAIGLLSFAVTFFYFTILVDLPSPNQLRERHQNITTKLYDRHGTLLYKIYRDENRSLIELSDLPQNLIDATIAIEDKDFYQHTGFSVAGIARAFTRNLLEQKVQGGSTITQQLVKNTLLSSEKTFTRKIKEVILAIGVELNFTKHEILTMYFNQVGYGGPIYGVQEAAYYYFDKPAAGLTLAQSALLAGLPAAPTVYSPYGANPQLAIVRQHEVLRRMVEDGYITQTQAEDAKNEPLNLARPKNNIAAPHFVMFVKNTLVNLLGESAVTQDGLNITTTHDLNLQTQIEQIVRSHLAGLTRERVSNAAVLVTHPQSGEIVAMVGSVDYFDVQNDGQVNVTTMPRQPGSSIKPLTYALAFENGFHPSSTVDDTPITYRVLGSPPYSPVNYDGRFHGTVTLRQALANSYNVPAVKILSHLGVNRLIDFGTRLGITTWSEPSRFGLSLTLGGGEVTMIDLATAYGVFAGKGVKTTLTPFISLTDNQTKTLDIEACTATTKPTPACSESEVISPATAFYITDILSDNRARTPTFGPNSKLNVAGHQVAAKTGTTNNLRDNWTIGYTSDYLVAVWVGNNDNTPMSNLASGVTGAAPIWHDVMTLLLKDQPPHRFSTDQDLIPVTVCPLTQTLTCPTCPNPTTEYFTQGSQPKRACTPEEINRIINPTPDSLPRDQILEGARTTN